MKPYAEPLDEKLTSTNLKHSEARGRMQNQSSAMSSIDKANTLKTKQGDAPEQFAVPLAIAICALMR